MSNRYHKGNQKILRDELKQNRNTPKSDRFGKAMLRGKFKAVNTYQYIKKEEFQINNLTLHL